MIISKTPLRVEFTGGSDLPAFYQHQPGAIVNVAIDKYIYVLVRHPDLFPRQKEVASDNPEQNQNILIQKTLKYKKIKKLRFTAFSDLPSQTGLGSSGSFVVGLLNTIHHIQDKKMPRMKIAYEAFYIENKLANINCGPQDQLAAALGGLRLHEFYPLDRFKSRLIACSPRTKKKLEDNLMLFFTGKTRSSRDLLDNLSNTLIKSAKARKLMAKRVELSRLMAKEIQNNSLESFGSMLDEEWRLKKAIAPIETNPFIDSIYSKAKKNGAEGGKLVGAGGSGFMLFYVPAEKREKVKRALLPLINMEIKFASSGSKIISGLG
jgi:D-glycero-alpha-D-manno-heptose-7-phosphate kinase